MSITRARVPMILGALMAVSLVAAGCGTGDSKSDGDPNGVKDVLHSKGAKPEVAKPVVHANVQRGATAVPVDRRLSVTADAGTLTSVAVSSKSGTIPGKLSADRKTWTAGTLLEPGTTYTVTSQAASDGGASIKRTTRFTTAGLTLDQQTYPSIAPLDGQTVGVGMPVIVTFDVPVTDRASIEKHLHVVAQPAQKGSWHWISNTEVHWRPARYWKAGSTVTVNADINSVPAGNGIFGQLDRTIQFHVGAAHVYKIDTRTDQMQVISNGKLLRTLPVTTGQQPAYTTRSGTKVIIEKFPSKDMNSETVGITGADAYNIKGVQWAMRVTYSGEFIHAAPWSVADQGHANVSHGCTGLSTANADWLYHMTNIGDVVQYTGTDKPMEFTNGYGDWNESFSQYKAGSALH
ncbi:L,D-transpeptidase [Nocardioides sp.]|jgi:lipoprotein-anchoring transpeptidase ErfK/SrfK|uniref:L,D-transpeptidase n=1 Tax=Nocardioides sp. TaxID=35761 RepID=UPI002F3EA796